MPFRKLTPKEEELYAQEICRNPEHDPPSHMVLAPGVHIWVCPGCGKEQVIHQRDCRWDSKGSRFRSAIWHHNARTASMRPEKI